MNHPSEWKKIYIPKRGKYAFKHKGTGVIRDSLMNIGKPLLSLGKTAAKVLAKKVVEKAADEGSKVIVKKAGDKLQRILRGSERSEPRRPSAQPPHPQISQNALIRLNQLIANS